ncbi:hypothetical protein NQ487_05590 [Hungatella hathewayi]|uniref:hypothetical protein n=2 Tax=Hungatella hathewayi TaxID=154046 RepID=UPI0021A5F31B|nr:hypothetical protein [Hungatella hathewayi]UWO86388.1 hypothetical protein NQ487_05590 [Hungatella hathewayi]
MATNTTNYNFKKPDESDFYSVQDQNNNWDKADAALKDLDTPTFEDYSGSTTVPDAATAINNIKSKGKLSTIVSNVKAAFKGACLIGQIVNNCVTNNAKLPLSAAQGKALMDLYTQLNSDLTAMVIGNKKITWNTYCVVTTDENGNCNIPFGYTFADTDICVIPMVAYSYEQCSASVRGVNTTGFSVSVNVAGQHWTNKEITLIWVAIGNK